MRVAKLRIEGFRGIRDGEFVMHQKTAIVGPNGCGKATTETPNFTFVKGTPPTANARAEGPLLRVEGPPPTATLSIAITVLDDPLKLRDFIGYLKMGLHEIGHSMGLNDSNGTAEQSVMNIFSESKSRPKELGGLRDDPLNWMASRVTECDIQSVKRSRAR